MANPKDRYVKIRPLLDAVKNSISKIEPELGYSVDEAMIPEKGQGAGNLRQYIENKPKKWGLSFSLLVFQELSMIFFRMLAFPHF